MYRKTNLLAKVMLLVVQACTLCSFTSTAILTNNYTDLHSLVAFKSAIEFDPNNVLSSNWTADTNFCHWHGVTCSKRRQRVTALTLKSMGLVGTISPHISNFTFLKVLDLRNNGFHGQVINELGHLSRLKQLTLGYNNLRGEIPISLPLCQKLEYIGINDNELTGRIPKNLTSLPRLQELTLGINNLTGTIPTSFGNMSNLRILGLEVNEFHGTIPNEVALLPRLQGLGFAKNYLTEYGMEGRVSTKGDTYSYGIMLLETFTRKKPTDEMLSEDLSLRQWVSSSVSKGTTEVVDNNLLSADAQGTLLIPSESNLLAVLDIGLGCSRDIPEERFDMKNVVAKLLKIKLQTLSK